MKIKVGAAALVAFLLATSGTSTAQTPAHTSEDRTVVNPDDGTRIAITVFKPGSAGPGNKVPVVLHSHGWGGSRTTTISGVVAEFLDAGMGVVSIDQWGHGASGGQAHVQDPTRETEDVKAVIDEIASLDWAALDAPGDPVLGAIGGSYGGGYQTMTALDEIADEGRTRFNVLAPEITWYDLPESLAPQDVPRTVWVAALYAAGARMLPQYVHEANAWGVATGQWPDGTLYGQPAPLAPDIDSEFHKHGPVWFAERGIRIDVPVLMRQGASDNLFNLNEGLHNFHRAVTPEARSQSYFVSHNGGHALPQAFPPGTGTSVAVGSEADACSTGGFTTTTIEFFRRVFAGESTAGLYPARYNFTNFDDGSCIHTDALEAAEPIHVDPLGTGSVASTVGAGAPLHLPVAEGPIALTGIPELTGTVTALGLDSRAFFALSMGTTPATARVIQNNVMPLRQPLPVTGKAFSIELPGVAALVPEGQNLYLTISPAADMFAGTGTKPAGAVVLSDLQLVLPRPAGAERVEATELTLGVEGRGASRALVATLTTVSGGPVADVEIRFLADGEDIGSTTTDAEGIARLPVPPRHRGGPHEFEARFHGDDHYGPSSASTTA